MASNNIILAVPSANSSVNYELPDSESAQLSFGPGDIDGLKMDANGGLVISFIEGGNVTLSNFQSFIDNGNTLSLADGTQVDPKLLFNALGGQNDNPFPGADDIKIGIPEANTERDITLEPGKKYLFNFDLSETTGADVKDGQMVIGFANGGKLVVTNYETAMADANPPELSLASKTCIVKGDELITNIQELAKANPLDGTEIVLTEEEQEALKRKSKIAAADMDGEDNSGIVDPTAEGYKAEHTKGEGNATDADAQKVAAVQPAAGEEADIARQLANIETAAGGAAGGRAGGYGYQSRAALDPFVTNPDIGPINPTQLNYRAPLLEPSRFLDTEEDTNPFMIGPDAKFLDETNLKNGPLQTSGALDIDFGADGVGGVGPNGSFSANGSVDNNVLSSNGDAITVTPTANGYVGTANGQTVFELTIDPTNGNYTYTQFLPLDHADPNDINDQITLNFGVVATDGDGDSDDTVIQIVIADDAPEISGASETVDETNLGPIVESGSLAHSFGQDGPGTIVTTGSFGATGSVANNILSSSGVAIIVSATPDGYVGKAGNDVAFTLTIQPNGDYTYTQYKNLDHADPNDPNDIITLTFGAKIIDFDGDSANAPIVINIKDDAPNFQNHGPKPDSGYEIVDETNLGPVVETGKLNADFGGDVPGSYAFKSGGFASSGSKLNGQLTHEGVAVVVTQVGNSFVGKAGDLTVFTLDLNTATGDYKFTLYDNFDHADGSNPDDVITLDFGVFAKDGDGDQVEGSIRIDVKDDAPIANDDVNTFDTTFGVANGNVITGLNGGPGAADDLSTDSDKTPQQNSVVKIAFGGNEVDVPAVGTVSIDGQFGKLTIAADGTYTYQAFTTGGMVTPGGEKHFTSGPALPDFDESEALDGVEQQSLGIAQGNLAVNAGDVVTVKYVGEVAGYSNTLGVFTVDAQGRLKAETIVIKSSDDATAGQSFSYTAATGAVSTGFFLIANGANENNNYAGIDLNTGALNFVYHYGQPDQRDAVASDDGAGISLVYTSASNVSTVLSGPLYFTTDRGGLDNLNADDSVRVVSGIPNNDDTTLRIGFEDLPGLGDKDFNDLIFDVSIETKDCGCGDPDIKDQFVYTLKDGDADTDKATLTLGGKDLTDDKPVITGDYKIVDESDLPNVPVQTGKIIADFGHDGPGTIQGNGFSSGGSKLNGQLTSGGVEVKVTQVGDTFTGKAGAVTVFTMQIKADGNYTFKLFDNLDHADGQDANDIITLNFGVDAIDCDNDKTHTTITIKVKDDAPVANDDHRSAEEGKTITGNVTENDKSGNDTPATVTKVSINGASHDVPNVGVLVISGMYGKLTIDKTGAYSYTANSNNPNGTDKFTYTYKDFDTDTDTAILKIDVTCQDDVPTVTGCVETVDETNLKDGTITETGSVTASYGNDGPGVVAPNGSFTSGGSQLNNVLTSNGVAIAVGLNGNTYEGKAGGVTVFTLKVEQNGSYSFKLFEQLDHADGNNPNDIIELNFGVKATDADGDVGTATIKVNVKDDAPIANDDVNHVSGGATSTSGNVKDNDKVGQDIEGTVTKVTFGGTTKDVPATGTVSITGAYGTLVIAATGAYTYNAKPNASGVDNFTYTLKDNDGDTDTACLTIDVVCKPIEVCVNADDACVKEDSHVGVPVSASFTGGSGNETMTLVLSGVTTGWTVTSNGWTNSGNGTYTLVLPKGQTGYNGSIDFKPPANSDADLNGLSIKASVYDPDSNGTTNATDDFKVITDAVIDPLKFDATITPLEEGGGKTFILTGYPNTQHAPLNITNILHNDNDGSESLKKIIFTVQDGIDNSVYISQKNADGTFTKVGTKGAAGADTTYTIDLSGMTYEQAKSYIATKLFLTTPGGTYLDGHYTLGIQLVSYEKNLSGIEKDYSDNETSYAVCLPIIFCISPLVIDMNHNGIELISVENGVLFDLTNDGVKDKTGWVAQSDALLALDKNQDGLINDRSELFGNTDDKATGFDSLAAYDLNNDGKIDANDAIFADLKVWQDANSDGISQASELKSLADVDIKAINLNAAEVSYDVAGNPITHESTVVYGDGSSSAIVDAWFAYNDGANQGVDKGLTLRGTDGSDVLSGGSGSDDLYGGVGADTFLFQTIGEGIDSIKDFNASEGDKIDLSNVLQNFDAVTDAITDFVFATETADGKTALSVNADGTGAAHATTFAIVEASHVSVSDLFNNGSIIV